MVTFVLSLVILVVGYFTYGAWIERMFHARDERPTPALTHADGVDYVPMGAGRNSLIQLLNIAGVGPIFGPIMGALYGPVAFLWIVFGAIFAGAVHDYLTGMISIRNGGAHLPALAEKYLGKALRHVVNGFALLLLVLVGTVFVTAPAGLIVGITPEWVTLGVVTVAIFIYYILATLLPVDQIIGRLYPAFGLMLLISAVGIGGSLILRGAPIPELTLQNLHPDNVPIFPLLFLTISCGALSGFHATQSPIISRTTQREGQGRTIFYGMMITEAVIAMIWAAAAMSLFDGQSLSALLKDGGPAAVVSQVATTTLGAVGGTLAIIGVIVLPITSGDTAFRSARMIIADYLKIGQKAIGKRLMIALPMFVIAAALTQVDFNILWRYFSWANQSTAMIALWVGAMYLALSRKNFWPALLPAMFMTAVTSTYILNAPIGFGLERTLSIAGGLLITALLTGAFFTGTRRQLAGRGPEGVPVDEPVPTRLAPASAGD